MTKKKSKRGGLRNPPGGRPVGSTKPDEEKAKRFTIRLYANELKALALLVKLGYGKTKTEVIRKAIMEVLGNFKVGDKP